MTRKEQKQKAQALIMEQLAKIGYGDEYAEYSKLFNSQEEADACMSIQMDRIAKLFGYTRSWFY